VIPNAAITIRNISTGVSVQAFSNGTGLYTASNLLPGCTRSVPRRPALRRSSVPG
jgi:hypothetical protein